MPPDNPNARDLLFRLVADAEMVPFTMVRPRSGGRVTISGHALKNVLIVLAAYEGLAVSFRAIQHRTGQTTDSVNRALLGLMRDGVLVRVRKVGCSYAYRVCRERLRQISCESRLNSSGGAPIRYQDPTHVAEREWKRSQRAQQKARREAAERAVHTGSTT